MGTFGDQCIVFSYNIITETQAVLRLERWGCGEYN